GNHQAEHMVAEELEPLIASRAVARTLERGNVRQRAVKQRNVFESVADALLERTVAAPTTRARVFLPVGRRARRAWRRGNVNGRRLLRHCDRFGFAAAAHRTSVNSRLQ